MGFKEVESAMYRFEQSLMKEPDDFYLYKDDLLGWVEIFKKANQKQLPVIPMFVADWINENKGMIDLHLFFTLKNNKHAKAQEWAFANSNVFARAVIDDFMIDDKLYYARIKGHELIDKNIEMDDDDKTDPEWYRNVYFVLQKNREIVIDMKDSGLSGAKHCMTKDKWNELGVNETNAEFIGVEY